MLPRDFPRGPRAVAGPGLSCTVLKSEEGQTISAKEECVFSLSI